MIQKINRITFTLSLVLLFVACKTTMPIKKQLEGNLFPVVSSDLANLRPPVSEEGDFDDDANKQFLADHYDPILVDIYEEEVKIEDTTIIKYRVVERLSLKNFDVGIQQSEVAESKIETVNVREFISAEIITNLSLDAVTLSNTTKIENLLEINLADSDPQYLVRSKVINPINLMEYYNRYGKSEEGVRSLILFPSRFAAPNLFNEYSNKEFKLNNSANAVVFDIKSNLNVELFNEISGNRSGRYVLQGFETPIGNDLWSEEPFVEVEIESLTPDMEIDTNLFDPSQIFPYENKFYTANKAYLTHLNAEGVKFSFSIDELGTFGLMSTEELVAYLESKGLEASLVEKDFLEIRNDVDKVDLFFDYRSSLINQVKEVFNDSIEVLPRTIILQDFLLKNFDPLGEISNFKRNEFEQRRNDIDILIRESIRSD